MTAYKGLAVLLALMLATAVIDGCRKRENKPAPQVTGTSAAGAHRLGPRGATQALPKLQFAPVGPVAQRLVQGTHLKMVPSRGNA